MSYLNDFLTIGYISLLGVVSPGPDFVVVTQKSLVQGRRAGLWAVAGISCGLSIHISYCLAGLGLVIASSETIFKILQFLGATYLIYLGARAYWPKGTVALPSYNAEGYLIDNLSAFHHFKEGFLVNILNLKAALFTISLFIQLIGPSIPLAIQIGLGIEMVLITALWFSFVAWTLSYPSVAAKLHRFQSVFDKIMGACLILLGLKLFTVKGML